MLVAHNLAAPAGPGATVIVRFRPDEALPPAGSWAYPDRVPATLPFASNPIAVRLVGWLFRDAPVDSMHHGAAPAKWTKVRPAGLALASALWLHAPPKSQELHDNTVPDTCADAAIGEPARVFRCSRMPAAWLLHGAAPPC